MASPVVSPSSPRSDAPWHHVYVFAKLRGKSVLIVATRTREGWRCRSTDEAVNHDYVSQETWEDLENWWDCSHVHRREECTRECTLSRLLTTGEDGAPPPEMGFLPSDQTLHAGEAVERVLRHLERGW